MGQSEKIKQLGDELARFRSISAEVIDAVRPLLDARLGVEYDPNRLDAAITQLEELLPKEWRQTGFKL